MEGAEGEAPSLFPAQTRRRRLEGRGDVGPATGGVVAGIALALEVRQRGVVEPDGGLHGHAALGLVARGAVGVVWFPLLTEDAVLGALVAADARTIEVDGSEVRRAGPSFGQVLIGLSRGPGHVARRAREPSVADVAVEVVAEEVLRRTAIGRASEAGLVRSRRCRRRRLRGSGATGNRRSGRRGHRREDWAGGRWSGRWRGESRRLVPSRPRSRRRRSPGRR
mmetsp:Transcript_34831/g.111635  ORF Transcript_34831/g.111635 Transcript_34831/m.111635 type:complete len:223 (-) Transcript_34831:612-1280(-)